MNAKKIAAEKAVEYVGDGMVVGLGTGSTAYWAVQKLGQRIKEEGLHITAVATSLATENIAKEAGIAIVSFAAIDTIDIAIDGADEVDANGNLLKGGGGALLREKIVASNSRQFIVVVDESKMVGQLGKFTLHVEILPFAAELTIKQLQSSGYHPVIRNTEGTNFITDNGNLIADCHIYPITDPATLNTRLHLVPGVVETGLFLHTMVHSIIVGYENGDIRVITYESN